MNEIRIRRRRATGFIGAVAAVAAIVGVFPASALAYPTHAGRPAAGGQFKGIGAFRDRPRELAFSPDGKVLATACGSPSAGWGTMRS